VNSLERKADENAAIAGWTNGLPTIGVEVHSVNFNNRTFALWDCAGQEALGGLRDGYFICAKGAILLTDLASMKEAKRWIRHFRRVCPTQKIVVVKIGEGGDYPTVNDVPLEILAQF
jgi:GTPase SAR1 family protein